jgi:hypothetical protein
VLEDRAGEHAAREKIESKLLSDDLLDDVSRLEVLERQPWSD